MDRLGAAVWSGEDEPEEMWWSSTEMSLGLGRSGTAQLGAQGDVLALQRAQQMPGLALLCSGCARVHFTPGGCRRFGEISLPHYPW